MEAEPVRSTSPGLPVSLAEERRPPLLPLVLPDRPQMLTGPADSMDFLSRIFPRAKRPVLQLMLSACDGDLVRTIDRVISSGERPEPLLPQNLMPSSLFGPLVSEPLSEGMAMRQASAAAAQSEHGSRFSPHQPLTFSGMPFPGSTGAPVPDPLSLGSLVGPRYPLLPPPPHFARGLPLSFPYPSLLPPMPVSLPYSGGYTLGGPAPNSKS